MLEDLGKEGGCLSSLEGHPVVGRHPLGGTCSEGGTHSVVAVHFEVGKFHLEE